MITLLDSATYVVTVMMLRSLGWRHYLILAALPSLALGLLTAGSVIQDYLAYRQSTCIAQVYGDYRVQVFATPAAPAPGEEVELTAVVKTLNNMIPRESIRVVLSIRGEGDVIPLASETKESRNGIFTFYHRFEEGGDYVLSFLIVGKSGVVNVEAPLTVGEPLPFENYIIPAVFLSVPIIIMLPLAYILKRRKPG
ncbi:MAG TPA: hypothetical protein EYH45_03705 [Candidatus Caldiarchaeum subterraneum]|uniref:YtkA-like domain-containing protein n=1 Tax=Caldiarchaeum subterraneum TaxID=311458 RepID=A0A832ZVK6_CALS0|nr:hypothetical protein [Candidatus Caldarchaeum subterraneum]